MSTLHSSLRYSPFSRRFFPIIIVTYYIYDGREERACLGRGSTDSNSSIPYFGFSVFSVNLGNLLFAQKLNRCTPWNPFLS